MGSLQQTTVPVPPLVTMNSEAHLAQMYLFPVWLATFLLLVLIPILHDPIIVIVLLWSAVAGFIAVRQGLDIGNLKTLFTIILATGVIGFIEWIQQVRILSDLP